MKYAGNKTDHWLGLMKEETYFTPNEAVDSKLATVIDEETEALPNDKHQNFSHMQPGAYGRTMTTVAMQRFKGFRNATKPENIKTPSEDPLDAERERTLRLFAVDHEVSDALVF